MEALSVAIGNLANPLVLVLCTVGGILGVVLGAIPGLSGGLAITVMLPMTFTMKAEVAIPFLMAIYVGSMSGSYIGAILLGIPGTPSSIATVYDGYAYTKKGQTVKALSLATMCNFIGTVPSVLIAMFLSSVIAKWAVQLGPWEFFSLGACAIIMVISLSKGNMAKGLLGAGLAILITSIGTSPLCGTQRFSFNNYYLSGGLPLTGVMLGLFAGRVLIDEYAKGSEIKGADVKVGRFTFPGKELISNLFNIVRSFVVGLWIGFLPGLGGSLSNQMAYAMAKNSSKRSEEFGTGCPDGVIAPEVANNASLGGALIPFIALGIPGDMVTALLLGALTIQGVETGPLIFRNAPEVVYLIFGACVMTAIIVVIFQIVGMPLFPMLLKIPRHYLYPAIFVICITGAYTSSSNLFSVFVVVAATAFGVLMAVMDIPSGPFMLTYVLASVLENNLRKGVSYAKNGYASFFTRPISCVLLLLALFLLVMPFIQEYRKKKKAQKADA